jgi:hypothetical protein
VSDHLTTDRPFFFVHIMKTAGMTFNAHIRNNFDRSAVYPGEDDQTGADYFVIGRLRNAIAERDGIRLWHGHFPYFVTELVPNAHTLCVLRDPVVRTISLLRQQLELNHPEASIEGLYDTPEVFRRTVREHQTKIFAMRSDEDIKAYTQPLLIDDERFEAAKERIASVELLGFQEDFNSFLGELERRWNWRIDTVPDRNTATEQRMWPSRSSGALRKRTRTRWRSTNSRKACVERR